jgi:DNA ligase-1
VLLSELVACSLAVAATTKRSEKVDLLAGLIRELSDAEVPIAVGLLSGEPLQGKVGVGWATGRIEGTASEPTLQISDLDRLFSDLASMSGAGVQGARRELLGGFGALATPAEGEFATALLTGELRQGALAGVVEQGAAKATGVPATALRRAAMLLGDLPAAVHRARLGGRSALDAVELTVGVAVQPMLASPAPNASDAIEGIESARVEWKLDGIRIQAHKGPLGTRLFTRNLNDITGRLPDVAAQVDALGATTVVLDGEVLGIDEAGAPLAFQDSLGSERVLGYWFDLLHINGTDLMEATLAERGRALEELVGSQRIPGSTADGLADVERVFAEAVDAGHEGIVVKDMRSTYQAGRRNKNWRKVKPVHTLDLVVIAVEWGSGRRKDWLSNLHLGALGTDGELVMVGKTFKGLTDELLTWQTAELLARETRREGHVVHVRPELVVEIALDGAQRSTRYPGGVALRFARVRRYRGDKSPQDADSIDAVRALLH